MVKLWVWFCRRMQDYHLELCAEAEANREFFRQFPDLQWETGKAYESRQYHALQFAKWLCRDIEARTPTEGGERDVTRDPE